MRAGPWGFRAGDVDLAHGAGLRSLAEPLLPPPVQAPRRRGAGRRSGSCGAGAGAEALEDCDPELPSSPRREEPASGEALETCCICLEALSADAVTPLLATEGWALQPASCRHYCHLRCATRLRPRRCPVCRVGFTQLRRVTREGLLSMTAAELRGALTRLHGHATATVAVDLVSAAFPIPAKTATEWLHAEGQDGSSLEEGGLAEVLHRLSLSSPGAPRRSLSFYAGADGRRAGRGAGARLRRCALRLCGAAGGACQGLLIGVVAGVLAGLLLRRPPRRWCEDPGRHGRSAARACFQGLDLVGPFLESLAPWHIFGSAFLTAVLAVVVGLLSVVAVKLLWVAGRKAAMLGRMAHRALWIWALAWLGAGATEEQVGRMLWGCSACAGACAGAAFGALCGLAHGAAVADAPRASFWRAALGSFVAGARAGCRLCAGRRRRARSERLGDGSLRDQ